MIANCTVHLLRCKIFLLFLVHVGAWRKQWCSMCWCLSVASHLCVSLFFEDWDFQINLREKGLSKNLSLNALVQWRCGGQMRAPAVHYVMGVKAKGHCSTSATGTVSTASDRTISASVWQACPLGTGGSLHIGQDAALSAFPVIARALCKACPYGSDLLSLFR